MAPMLRAYIIDDQHVARPKCFSGVGTDIPGTALFSPPSDLQCLFHDFHLGKKDFLEGGLLDTLLPLFDQLLLGNMVFTFLFACREPIMARQ